MGHSRRLPAWLLSLILHATLLTVFVWTLRFAPRGVLVEPDRGAGIALVKDLDGRREYFDERLEPQDALSTAGSIDALQGLLPDENATPIDLAAILPEAVGSVGAAAGEALPRAGDMTLGKGGPKVIGGSVRTEVFGVAGEGTKFVYVFDRSGSMEGFGGRPLTAAKAQLLASLDDLDSIHQFQIIFYNERPRVFNPDGGTPRLKWGDDASKDLAARFVRGIVADGGTEHMDALTMALNMRPDVVFFLTDADEPRLTTAELAKIRRLNRGTVINAIEFGFGPRRPRDNFLSQLAGQNGGQHAYVDISQLRQNR